MKLLTFALIATTLASAPLYVSAHEPTPTSPATGTAALLASGSAVRIAQIQVEVNTRPQGYYYNDAEQNRRSHEYRRHHHHRRYHTHRVVTYRHGVRYVSYRRVYDRY